MYYQSITVRKSKLRKFQKFYIQDWLKVRKSRKQIMVSSILPKNERWDNFHYIKLSQRSFFGRIEDTINCFRDLLTFIISTLLHILIGKMPFTFYHRLFKHTLSENKSMGSNVNNVNVRIISTLCERKLLQN